MAFDLADRGIYGFSTTENLRFADVDANGHINNGAFLELLENVRVSYLRQIVRTGLPRFRMVVGRIEADFKRQMFYPGTAAEFRRRSDALSVLNTADFADHPGRLCAVKRTPGEQGPASREQLEAACRALPELDANANAIAIETLKLENEGWALTQVPELAEPTLT